MWAAVRHLALLGARLGEQRVEPVLLTAREIKVPEPRQTSQFERPWDLFVPAKSVGKLTAGLGVSKALLRSNWLQSAFLVWAKSRPKSVYIFISERAPMRRLGPRREKLHPPLACVLPPL